MWIRRFLSGWYRSPPGVCLPLIPLESSGWRELEPEISEQIIGAILTAEDGIADHMATMRSYARVAEKLGVGSVIERVNLGAFWILTVVIGYGAWIVDAAWGWHYYGGWKPPSRLRSLWTRGLVHCVLHRRFTEWG